MNKNLQRTCTGIVLLINLLFGDVLVAVAVVACLCSLILLRPEGTGLEIQQYRPL